MRLSPVVGLVAVLLLAAEPSDGLPWLQKQGKAIRAAWGRGLAADSDSDVAGPVVTAEELIELNLPRNSTEEEEEEPSNLASMVEAIDEKLRSEFAKPPSPPTAASFNESAHEKGAVREEVVRISTRGGGGGNGPKGKGRPGRSGGGGGGGAADGKGGGGQGSGKPGEGSGGQQARPRGQAGHQHEHAGGHGEGVDRIITRNADEFVLSKSSNDIGLQLDPQLVADLTTLLVTSAVLGMLFESLNLPVINGYLVAGALVGPGALDLVRELVQAQSIAQLGVSLLLFGLGMELSFAALRRTFGVAVVGGTLQILLSAALGGAVAVTAGATARQGAFIGVLVSMSSTSVVVKCLDVLRTTHSHFGQIVIGTLLLQDCTVGIVFALMSVFAPKPGGEEQGNSSEASAAVILVVLRMVGMLLSVMAAGWVFATLVLSRIIVVMRRHASVEVQQLSLTGMALAGAWCGGRLGLSDELGAFLAGAMVAAAAPTAERLAAATSPFSLPGLVGGPSKSVIINGVLGSVLEGGANGGLNLGSPDRDRDRDAFFDAYDIAEATSLVARGASTTIGTSRPGTPHAAGGGGGHHREKERDGGGPCPPVGAHALRHLIDSVHNVLCALFLSCTGLIMSPSFLWAHLPTLAVGTLVVLFVKTTIVAGVVRAWGSDLRTSILCGLTLAHVGEFSFVLLASSANYKILPPQVYLFLLGLSALSLLTTPLVIMVCNRLLGSNLASSVKCG